MNGYETTPEFQSTPPRGWRRWWNGHKRRIRFYFNPLHHEGGDGLMQPRPPVPHPDFNPLHHEGGDFVPSANFFFLYRFQSTPPRGWRLSSSFGICISVHFNPLHHEGGDCADQWLPVVVQYFNPLHHEGGDQRPQQNRLCLSIFQSTPPRGWRRKRGTFYGKINRFQSTPPRGWRQIKVKRNTVATYISIHSTTRVET